MRQTDHAWTNRNEQYASKEEFIKLNKERRSIPSRFQWLQKNQKESISKFRWPSKLKLNLTVKESSEKAWLLHEFPFCLNPGDKPNDAQAWKNYSSLYPVSAENQFQVNSKKKKKLMGHFRGSKIKPTKY